MKKYRIMHILNTADYSGAENVVVSIIRHLGTEFDFCYVSLDGTIRNTLKKYHIRFFPVKKISGSELKRAVKAVRPDLIHAHDYTAGVAAAVSVRGIPVINHLHHNPPWIKRAGLKSLIYILSGWRYQLVLTVSAPVMDEYIFGKWMKRKTKVIGNPLSVAEIREGLKSDTENGVTGTWEIAFLGRFSRSKNPCRFVRIVEQVKKKIPDIRAVMIGDGALRSETELLIRSLGLRDQIVCTGFMSNPYPVLARAGVLCMPSEWEGFGLAAVEALALGKPVAASPAGGLKYIVNDECGKLCKTTKEFASEIVKLLSDEQYYKRKSEKAAERAAVLDNTDEYYNSLQNIYQMIMKKNTGIFHRKQIPGGTMRILI